MCHFNPKTSWLIENVKEAGGLTITETVSSPGQLVVHSRIPNIIRQASGRHRKRICNKHTSLPALTSSGLNGKHQGAKNQGEDVWAE